MSLHHELMNMARQTLHDNMGRLASYSPPEGANAPTAEDVSVRWTSAKDDLVETDSGLQNLRTVTVAVRMGAEAGMLPAAHRNGVFKIDVDGTGSPLPWTIRQFENVDGESGFIRCLCTRPIAQSGVMGKNRPRQ